MKPPTATLASFNVGKNGCNIIHMTTKVVELEASSSSDSRQQQQAPGRPAMARRTSSSSTLIDLTDGAGAVTVNNYTPTPRSNGASSVPVDLTEDDPSPVVTSSSGPVPTPLAPGRPIETQPGKRGLPLETRCPDKVAARLRRLESQRLYLFEQSDASRAFALCKEYTVMGSTGTNYDVVISARPSCTCEDATGEHAVRPCKHILFVLVKVSYLLSNLLVTIFTMGNHILNNCLWY
jgi:hypothetical protein